MIIIKNSNPDVLVEDKLTITKIDINPNFIILTCLNDYNFELIVKIERDDFIVILKRFCDELHL